MMRLRYVYFLIRRAMYKVFRRLPTVLSYLFLAFSVFACLIILIPNCFSKVPVLSYYIHENEFPITYELLGEVKILDDSGNIVNKDVEVYIGGYSTSLTSTNFSLKFTSRMTDEFYVVIIYEVDGKKQEYTKRMKIKDGNHSIYKEFVIYA